MPETPETAVNEEYMPICDVCGKPMKLVGLREKAAIVGVRLPNDEEQYVVQCCGCTMTIDDPKLAEIATRNLRRYYYIKD
jgi:hypothetical protein